MATGASDSIDWREARFRVGDCLIDAAANEIARDGRRIVVRDKVMAGLVHLVSNRDTLVTKDELLSALWPAQTPSEESLTQVISELRRALGDTAKQAALIRTAPKRGYRLVAPVELVTDQLPASAPVPGPVAASVTKAPVMGRFSAFVVRHPQVFIALSVTVLLLQNVLRTLIHHH